ncbi:hypothetical protein EYF80_064019 [Liparis tanakae]|uniref:Uncharacterized protein n=1 Tax=Liparis tanakae TaxID=230148 RepID=A0A4Z2EAK5_9TELE|nr:hypothetical protein EYF80_064019 [Liparis tanakae]
MHRTATKRREETGGAVTPGTDADLSVSRTCAWKMAKIEKAEADTQIERYAGELCGGGSAAFS